jgi:hypothetical protein
MNDKYTMSVKTPGQMIIFRGKQARTPAKFKNILKYEVDFLLNQCRRFSLKFEIKNETEEDYLFELEKEQHINYFNSEPQIQDLVVDECIPNPVEPKPVEPKKDMRVEAKKENKSILQTLVEENKEIPKPKVIVKKEPKDNLSIFSKKKEEECGDPEEASSILNKLISGND